MDDIQAFLTIVVLAVCVAFLAGCAEPPANTVHLSGNISKFEDKENGVTCYRTGVSGGSAISCVKVKP